MPWPRLPGPAPVPAPRPVGGRGRASRLLPVALEICTVWNMIDVTRESTAPVDRLWSVHLRRAPLAAVAAHGGCRDPPRPGPPRRGGRVLHRGAARAAAAVWTITAWEEGRSFTWESTRPGIRSVGTHTLRPGAGRQHHHRARHHLARCCSHRWCGWRWAARACDYVTREAAALDADGRRGRRGRRRPATPRVPDVAGAPGPPARRSSRVAPPATSCSAGRSPGSPSTASATPACAPSRPASAPATGCSTTTSVLARVCSAPSSRRSEQAEHAALVELRRHPRRPVRGRRGVLDAGWPTGAQVFAPLFFELSTHAMRGQPHAAGLRVWLRTGWLDALGDGLPRPRAAAGPGQDPGPAVARDGPRAALRGGRDRRPGRRRPRHGELDRHGAC